MNQIQRKSLKLSLTRKSNRNLSIDKTDEIRYSNRYKTLYTDNKDDESCNSYENSTFSDIITSSSEISDEISWSNIQKIKKFQRKGRKRKEGQKNCH